MPKHPANPRKKGGAKKGAQTRRNQETANRLQALLRECQGQQSAEDERPPTLHPNAGYNEIHGVQMFPFNERAPTPHVNMPAINDHRTNASNRYTPMPILSPLNTASREENSVFGPNCQAAVPLPRLPCSGNLEVQPRFILPTEGTTGNTSLPRNFQAAVPLPDHLELQAPSVQAPRSEPPIFPAPRSEPLIFPVQRSQPLIFPTPIRATDLQPRAPELQAPILATRLQQPVNCTPELQRNAVIQPNAQGNGNIANQRNAQGNQRNIGRAQPNMNVAIQQLNGNAFGEQIAEPQNGNAVARQCNANMPNPLVTPPPPNVPPVAQVNPNVNLNPGQNYVWPVQIPLNLVLQPPIAVQVLYEIEMPVILIRGPPIYVEVSNVIYVQHPPIIQVQYQGDLRDQPPPIHDEPHIQLLDNNNGGESSNSE